VDAFLPSLCACIDWKRSDLHSGAARDYVFSVVPSIDGDTPFAGAFPHKARVMNSQLGGTLLYIWIVQAGCGSNIHLVKYTGLATLHKRLVVRYEVFYVHRCVFTPVLLQHRKGLIDRVDEAVSIACRDISAHLCRFSNS